MLFSSPLFMFLYLPVLLGLYFIVSPKARNTLLLAASLLFYIWGEKTYVLVMIAIIAVNYAWDAGCNVPEGKRSTRWVVAAGCDRQPWSSHRLQVFQLPGRSAQSCCLAICASAHGEAGSGSSAAGDLVLHVPCIVVRDRCLPARRAKPASPSTSRST